MDVWIHVFVGGVGAAVLTVVAARVGLPGRALAMNYLEKRLNVVSTLLVGHENRLSPYEIKELEDEVRSIAGEIAQTTDSNKGDWITRWNQQRLWKRLFVLPRPRSLLARALTYTAYIYLATSILYVAAWLFAPWFPLEGELASGEVAAVFPVGSLVSLLLFVGLRKLCITVARRDIAKLTASQRQSDNKAS